MFMAYGKKDELIDRLRNNYSDFRCSLRGMSRERLFGFAGRISAVTDAFEFYTKDYAWDDDDEVKYMLLFRDPLTILADALEQIRNDNYCDTDEALSAVMWDEKAISEYPLTCDSDKYFY